MIPSEYANALIVLLIGFSEFIIWWFFDRNKDKDE